jgi:CopA family copper-resistance protein
MFQHHLDPEKMSQMDRRLFLKAMGASAFATGLNLALPLPAWGNELSKGIDEVEAKNLYNLTIDYSSLVIDGKKGRATTINGTVPGPLLRWKEGEHVRMNVKNNLMDSEHASIHWHGILVPFRMDGVPGVNFKGIKPGETYEYHFQVKQYGTYWYHSHSAFQEQTGTYGPLIIDPQGKEPFHFDREHVVVLSDWSFENPEKIFKNLHKIEGYYNFQKRTIFDLFENMKEEGAVPALRDWLAWDKMRMSPVDILDVTGYAYTYLMNGNSPDMNWTGLFEPGEVVRLRFINASAMSNMDVRIPGLDLEVVMVDGKPVRPVKVHEFRIGVAETYDVLVKPKKNEAFTIFAEAQDRSGYTRGTLAPKEGMSAPVPSLRKRPVRDLKDIGMKMMSENLIGEMDHSKMKKMKQHNSKKPKEDPSVPGPNGPTPFKPDKGDPEVVMVISNPQYRLDEPGLGLGDDGWKVLTYADLQSAAPQPYSPIVQREMTINLTANMERYMFSLDGKKFTDQPGPYHFRHNERLRLFLVNHTMMDHPMHLHGMWMQLENGHDHDKIPFKHTVLVKPGEKLSVLITPIEKGDWAFHCHFLYHMEAGMFQVVRVS